MFIKLELIVLSFYVIIFVLMDILFFMLKNYLKKYNVMIIFFLYNFFKKS